MSTAREELRAGLQRVLASDAPVASGHFQVSAIASTVTGVALEAEVGHRLTKHVGLFGGARWTPHGESYAIAGVRGTW